MAVQRPCRRRQCRRRPCRRRPCRSLRRRLFLYPLNCREHGSPPSLTTSDTELVSVLEVRIKPQDLNPRPLTLQSVTLPQAGLSQTLGFCILKKPLWYARLPNNKCVNCNSCTYNHLCICSVIFSCPIGEASPALKKINRSN